ncbi:cysteine desulfurase [Tyzzerella sp. OttesenSCG-928-J15]|nr:cysteine desulfurase [Tyzzerella sp. OttesenSCG-928-J15]
MMNDIYFDNAATTKPYNEAISEFARISAEVYANSSALHKAGLEAERIIRSSGDTICSLLNVAKGSIYFTSGGTESNNLAIFGLAYARRRTHTHIITQLGEHPAVIQPFKRLEQEGFEVTWLKPEENGLVSPAQVEAALRESTGLVAIMQVNNETGGVYDIQNIGKIIKQKSSAYYFCDGAQGFGKIKADLKYVDGYSFTGHKCGAVKGTGGLYINPKVRIVPQTLGGGQQNNIRSGTENTAGCVSLAKAAEIAFNNIDENFGKVNAVKNTLLQLGEMLDNVHVNALGDSPYILNLSFTGVRSEVLLHALAEEGLFVSAGSACSANKKDKERNILYSLGLSKEVYESAVRLSFSAENTVEEAERAIELICNKVQFLRKYTRK